MHGVRQWWVRLSIVNKAIVLSCAFVIPILLVVGLLMNDFYDYREKAMISCPNMHAARTT